MRFLYASLNDGSVERGIVVAGSVSVDRVVRRCWSDGVRAGMGSLEIKVSRRVITAVFG